MNVLDIALPRNPYAAGAWGKDESVHYADNPLVGTGDGTGAAAHAKRLAKQYPAWPSSEHHMVSHHIDGLHNISNTPSSPESRMHALDAVRATKTLEPHHLAAVAGHFGLSLKTRKPNEMRNAIGKEIDSRQRAAYREGNDDWRHVAEHDDRGTHTWMHTPTGETRLARNWARPVGQEGWVNFGGASNRPGGSAENSWVHAKTGERKQSIDSPDAEITSMRDDAVGAMRHLMDMDPDNPVHRQGVHTFLDMAHDKESGDIGLTETPEYRALAEKMGYEGPKRNRSGDIKIRPPAGGSTGKLDLKALDEKLANAAKGQAPVPLTGDELHHLTKVLKGEHDGLSPSTSEEQELWDAIRGETTTREPVTLTSMMQGDAKPAQSQAADSSSEPGEEGDILGDISDVGLLSDREVEKAAKEVAKMTKMNVTETRRMLDATRQGRAFKANEEARKAKDKPVTIPDYNPAAINWDKGSPRPKSSRGPLKYSPVDPADPRSGQISSAGDRSSLTEFPSEKAPLGQRLRYVVQNESKGETPVLMSVIHHLVNDHSILPSTPTDSWAADAVGTPRREEQNQILGTLRDMSHGAHHIPEAARMANLGQARVDSAERGGKAIAEFLHGADNKRARLDPFELQYLAGRVAKRFAAHPEIESLRITKADAKAMNEHFGHGSRML